MGLSLLLAGCGGQAASAPPPAPAATASAAAPAPVRGPSPEIAKLFPFGARPAVVGYADVAGLRATALAGTLAEALAPALGGNDPGLSCAKALWATAREVAVGGDEGGFVALVRFDGPPPLPSCAAILGPPAGHIEGAAQTFDAGDGGTAAVQGNVLAIGRSDLVAAAFKGVGAGSGGALGGLALDDAEYLRIFVDLRDPRVSGHGSLVASSQRFSLDFEGEAPPGLVGLTSAMLSRGRTALQGEEGAARLLQAVSIAQTGNTAHAKFELEEPPDAQAHDLATAASLGLRSLRRYMTEAKQAEARVVTGEIATHLSDWVDHENGPDPKHHAKAKLFSLPPVPAAVPSGNKVQSSRADWKDWAKIQFEMTEPQYFQYEVKAAKDGQSADIVARGDLNADGKEQRFTIHVTLDRASGRLVVPPEVTEENTQD